MERLDNQLNIKNFDSKDKYHDLIHLPEDVLKYYNNPSFGEKTNFKKKYENKIDHIILVCSTDNIILGEIFEILFSKEIFITTCLSSDIPLCKSNSLVIFCDTDLTEELISRIESENIVIFHKDSLKIDSKSNMMMNQLQNSIEEKVFTEIFFSLIRLLEDLDLISDKKQEVKAVVANLISKAGPICYNTPGEQNLAKHIAYELFSKIPITYSVSSDLLPLAKYWKQRLLKLAKQLTFNEDLTNLGKNYTHSWNSKVKYNFLPIFINKFTQTANEIKHLNNFKNLLEKNNNFFLECFTEGNSLLEQYFSLIYLSNLVSFYLAILNENDPSI